MQEDCPEAKKPCKGILKSSSSFDRPGASYRKSAKFDELNVLQTLHPVDKDYGHMQINEPKTPFNYSDNSQYADELDADLLAEKLQIAANTRTPAFGAEEDLSDDDFGETTEERVRRLEFERRRKIHYNEYEAVRLARKLIEEELEDDEEEEVTAGDEPTGPTTDSGAFAQPSSELAEEETLCEGAVSEKEGEKLFLGPKKGVADAEAPPAPERCMDVDPLPPHPCAGREHD